MSARYSGPLTRYSGPLLPPLVGHYHIFMDKFRICYLLFLCSRSVAKSKYVLGNEHGKISQMSCPQILNLIIYLLSLPNLKIFQNCSHNHCVNQMSKYFHLKFASPYPHNNNQDMNRPICPHNRFKSNFCICQKFVHPANVCAQAKFVSRYELNLSHGFFRRCLRCKDNFPSPKNPT
jgi:hypothetical protein